MKLSVGLARKVGLPHYSSLQAHCGVELELADALLGGDADAFLARVRAAFDSCAGAVEGELARQQALGWGMRPEEAEVAEVEGHPVSPRHDEPAGGGRVTPTQLRALRSLCGRRRLDLHDLVAERLGVADVEALSAVAAGHLIEALQAPAGRPG